MKNLFLLLVLLFTFSCTQSDDCEIEEETSYCIDSNCYAIKLGPNYEPTGEEPEMLLPEGTNIYSGDFVFCQLPHDSIFFSAGYYFRVDCRYE